MSNSWDKDIEDELLALAGDNASVNSASSPHTALGSGGNALSNNVSASTAPTKSRKKRQASSGGKVPSKRRKPDMSDNEPESEEDAEPRKAYPLEGKYIDEADRERLERMSEVERESVLAQRQEEMQRIVDKRNLDLMLKAQASAAGKNVDDDSVSKAAKRQHSQRGATKEKTKKLDELKARRRAKDEKKRTKVSSPKRERSSSPMEMETSEEEEEDGQITKFDEQDEKFNRATAKVPEEGITLENMGPCQLSRDVLLKHCVSPWFGEFVKGCWVRYLIGNEDGGAVYRVCEIQGVSADWTKIYNINDMSLDFALDLKHGQSVKAFPIDRVSNAAITQREFGRVVKTWQVDKVKLPTKRALETKVLQMKKLVSAPMTESDVAAMLARKSQLQAHKPSAASFTLEKARLNQARTLAIRRQDDAELAELDEKLAELAAVAASQAKPMYGAIGMRGDGSGGGTDVLAKVNERNRKANIEAVRQAELRDAEKKRRERRLANSRAGTPGVAGSATAPTQDPSARLRTVPRLMQPASPRPGTPVQRPPPSQTSADAMLNNPLVVVSSPTPATPLPGAVATLEARIIDSIEINIGDF